MTTFSHGELVTLYICSICTGSLSLISSGTITVMIMISKDRLAYPFRRLIFGLSVADVIQSAAMIAGPFALPKHQQGVLWSNGSEFTCELQGFALHTGFAGVPMYVLSLSAYYLCAVRYNMKDRVFSKQVEPYLHAVSIIWTIGGGVACWTCGVFNMMASGNVCWYTPYPSDCLSNDDVECQRGKLAFTFGWLFGGSNAVTLCAIMCCLGGVIKTVRDQELKNKTYDFQASHISHVSQKSDTSAGRRMSSAILSIGSVVKFDKDGSSQSTVEQQPNTNGNKTIKPKKRVMQRTSIREASINQRYAAKTQQLKRETMTQSMLYIVSFLASCAWAYLYGFLVTIGIKLPFVICLFFSIFYPLGGVFNILVYTRPKIRSLRRKHKQVSWPRAFFEVIKAGVEVPKIIIRKSGSDSAEGFSGSNMYSNSYTNGRNSYSISTDDPLNSKKYSEVSYSQNLPTKFNEEDEYMRNSTSSKNDSTSITDDDYVLNINFSKEHLSNYCTNENNNRKNQGTHTKGDLEHGNSHDITTKLDTKPP